MRISISAFWTLLFAATALALPADTSSQPTSYDGYKVIRIQLDDNQAKTDQVRAMIQKMDLETWTNGYKPNRLVDVVVEPSKIAAFDSDCGLNGIQYTTMHEDLGKSIREENSNSGDEFHISSTGKGNVQAAADMTWFNNYHPYADHITWLNSLVTQFPQRTKIVTAGNSYQGRPITGIHIFGSSGGGQRPAVVLHGTVHAREWISTMVTEFTIYSLLSNYANATDIKTAVDKYDFYIFPVVNPDGFIYTQTNTRLWRKNRAPNAGSACDGTDINRNWAAQWAVTGGASTNPCDQDFKGPSVGSTPEYKALSSFQDAKAKAQGVIMYMDIHSYSQLWMTPYGYTCTTLPTNSNEQVTIARGAVSALKSKYGTTFTAGPTCQTIYKATGGSVDYSYDTTGAKYSFAVELRDTGAYGFVLPANQIYPSGVEFFEGFRWALANIK
ncbi:hypothetical protein FPQ18DRAFT_312953 [Pyronema domesticum]|uniref:Similar to Metallocarboxypeptidase A-like protein ARB_03789 acc. no. D4B5N0 n=1 Tax=Pyronema omphalodes (strain CBS 100304) TaxID=1076935 RepID=U4LT62_PYROM|nr:hypothetical protein FPQ18DRAFT_312953 [Pyronema domesticum]CCX32640.1 Similar to Metallocarboxypeptidase A-like protein ARB_03789; acc. no. D4B5N0 [Pyronema omphalodes CBS 100304]